MSNDTAAHFDRVFGDKGEDTYVFDDAGLGPKDRQIVRELKRYGIAGKRCLDVGSGTGRWLQFLAQQQPEFLAAIDFSEEAIQRAQMVCGHVARLDVETERFRFQDDFFDIVISFEVIEHLRIADNFIAEIIRVAKPGALVLLSTPNLVALNSRFRMLLGFPPVAVAADSTHVSFFTSRRLTKTLEAFSQYPEQIMTSISLSLRDPKHWRLAAPRCLRSLVDSLLFRFIVNK